jgi:hypothetical protein
MSRRPASITQAEVKRMIRAARQAGLEKIEVKLTDGTVISIPLSTGTAKPEEVAPKREVVL